MPPTAPRGPREQAAPFREAQSPALARVLASALVGIPTPPLP